MGAGFTVRNSEAYGIIQQNSSIFNSPIDSKGRALVSAGIRRQLGLRFGTPVVVKVGDSDFSTKVDERGRFSVPSNLRQNLRKISGEIVRARCDKNER